MRDKDMYGNEIHALGNTGFAASMEFHERSGLILPELVVFHEGNAYKQCLFGLRPFNSREPLSNVFEDAITDCRNFFYTYRQMRYWRAKDNASR